MSVLLANTPPVPPLATLSPTLDQQVAVVDNHGRVQFVPQASVRYSPAVYGVLVEENRALLCVHSVSGFYLFPGGRVTTGQTVEEAVRQRFRAATGITPYVQGLLLVEEALVLDEESRPWHLTLLYYRLSRPPVGQMGLIDFENSAKPDWVPLNQLERNQMQFGYDALLLART